MIWKPKAGQSVQARYRVEVRDVVNLHEKKGVILAVANGRGPVNALVHFPAGEENGSLYGNMKVIPRGNLFAVS